MQRPDPFFRAEELLESKSVKMMSFDLGFKVNISLPQYIGLGKQVSTGHGMIIIP